MPLQLGDITTERTQTIVYDPDNEQEKYEAGTRGVALVMQGFIPREHTPGKAIYDPPPRDPNKGLFRILSQNGDDRIVWDRRVAAQVKEAFVKFKELIAKGYKAYATVRGKRSHRITDFDPGLEEILFVPATMPG